jgi:CheY-like chemotaxis protein
LSFQEPPSYYGDSIPVPITVAKGGSYVPDAPVVPDAPSEDSLMDVPKPRFVEAATMSGIPVRTTVLVVDDDHMMRQLQVMIAHELGLLTLEADSLAGGREILATDGGHIGLVLLDVHLPDGSGVTLCEEITSGKWPGAQQVPIVMVTSDDDESVMENAFFAGSVSQLHKPFEPEDLVRVIREHVIALVSESA